MAMTLIDAIRQRQQPAQKAEPRPLPPSGAVHLTDLGNARRLIQRHGADMRHVPAWGWLCWDGKRWRQDDDGQIMRWAKDTAIALYDDALALLQDAKQAALMQRAEAKSLTQTAEAVTRWALTSQGRARLEAMVELASTEPEIIARVEDFDANPMLLNCANGIIDLEYGALQQHRREALCTKLAPAEYDPAATNAVWGHYLDEATQGDAALAAYLQRAVGYTLTGLTDEQIFFMVLGPAATGKTTLIEALLAVLGDYAHKANFETFLERHHVGAPRPDIADLVGARLVAACEVAATRRMAEVMVKELTGGDRVSARQLYCKEFSFMPSCKLWLAANEAPKIRDDDAAIWRRLRRVPFEHVIPEADRDPQVKVELLNPKTGGKALLAWAVAGAVEWRKSGLQYPDVIRSKTESLRAEMDPLSDWINECCTLGEHLQTSTSELRASYETWCKERGDRNMVNGREWGKRLRGMKCEPGRVGRGSEQRRVWYGIGLLTDSAMLTDLTGPFTFRSESKTDLLRGFSAQTSTSVNKEESVNISGDYEEIHL